MAQGYKRVLIKISGEALAGDNGFGFDDKVLASVSKSVKDVYDLGCEICVVVGGGNIWRGRSGENMDRTRADHMGMLATVINALAMADSLEANGVPTRVQTGIEMRQIAEPYIRNKAIRHFEKGRVVIFGCGTGSPYFSTDTAASLRAAEIKADVMLKATNVDGVYNKDPNKFDDAVKFDSLTHADVVEKGYGVMDSTAAALCKDNNIPILVFNLQDPENIFRAVTGEEIGTLVVD